MSPLDPYSGTEPRGWERSDRPPALPWPDREVEPWSPRQSGTDLSAVPQAPPRPPVRRHDESPDGPYDPPVAGRPFADDDAPTSQLPPVRDDDAPTAQLTPVRDDTVPTPPFFPAGDDAARPEADADLPEPPPGRRPPGRRRASAERPATGQPSTGRAGRNLPAAIGVGLGLGALVLVPLFFFLPGFLAVLAGAIGVGIWEMARAVRRSGAHPPLVPLLAGGVLTIGLAWFAGPDALSLGLLVTVLGTMIWRLGDGPAGFQRDITAATLIAVYVPFLGGFAAMLAAAPGDGPLRVLVTVAGVVLSDTGGYAAGANFGKHPMAPRISPKKSWEGFAGSVVAAAVGSALLIWLLFDVAPWWGALFGVAVSVAAVLGDLAESMIKRDLGVKDMSSLLPGHGGLMDRLDSILFAVPTAYLLLAVLVPVVG
ncbi:phosphatidate cytidylyltransferase [Micromonospora wenchangensis]|uniref:phosphatidate cytidylyltransferase n=1 Tax=Micromonospora wenchangensis TaxID=1185415 RepID=UPI003D74F2D7